MFKKKDKDSDSNKEKKSFSKIALDASKILVGTIAVKAADEISKIVVKPPKKPENVSRTNYIKSKPTRTFTQAARTVNFWRDHPDYYNKAKEPAPKEDYSDSYSTLRPPSVIPGLDGLVSFSILLAPFAILLGLINYIFQDNLLVDVLLWMALFLYILFVALPGAYLGLDAIREGTKALLINSGATIKFGLKGIYYFFKIFIQGIYEILLLFFTTFFENVFDYWVFVFSYIGSVLILFFIFNTILANVSLLTLFLLIIIPSLLPASILHRYWLIFRFNQKYPST